MTDSAKIRLLFLFSFATCIFTASHSYSQVNTDSIKAKSQDSFQSVTTKAGAVANKIEKADINSILFRNKFFKKVSTRTAAFTKKLESVNEKYLKKYLKADNALQEKLTKVNPTLATHLFSPSVDPIFNHQKDPANPEWLKNKPSANETYAPLDTMKASLNTMAPDSSHKESASKQGTADSLAKAEKAKAKTVATTEEKDARQDITKDSARLRNNLQNSEGQLVKSEENKAQPSALLNANKNTKQLEQRLNYSQKLQQYFRQRKIRIKEVAIKYPDFQKNFLSMDKINYYYRQQIAELKKLFAQGQSKIEQQATNAIKNNKVFRHFMQKSGQFSAAANKASTASKNSTGKNTASADSLSAPKKLTVDEVNQMMQHDIKALGEPAADILTEKMKPMTDALSKLKSGNYGNTTNADDLPGFKPNPLKTKPTTKRLQFGVEAKPIAATTVSSPQKGLVSSPAFMTPKGGSFAVIVGYQLTKKITVGVGASRDEGINATWRKIKGTGLATGLRSFTDWKVNKKIYIEAGYEKNLLPLISSTTSGPIEMANGTQTTMQWVSSALLGVKFKPGVAASPTMTLLYDFLHSDHIPATPALIYRFGWAFGGK